MKIEPTSKEQIYTLAESRTANYLSVPETTVIKGEGTLISNSNSLQSRARRKTISRAMILALIDVAKEKGDQQRLDSYWNAFYCQTKMAEVDGHLHADYCKTRYCTICLAIRKAEVINKYYPVLKKWDKPHFVTLTVKAVPAAKLKTWFAAMKRAFKLIHDRCKKREQRVNGIKLIGVKSLECNFNPLKRTYNPHFHIIVPDRETADLLKEEWLKTWTTKFTYKKAQHIRAVENLERDLIETIKYGSKIFTEPDLKHKGKQKIPPNIYASALDNIFAALSNKRLFDRFGFNLPKQEQKQSSTRISLTAGYWTFDPKSCDWVNEKTGELLTGYHQPPELEFLLKNSIDKELN